MNKQEFLHLFELEDIYLKHQTEKSFGFGLFDHLTGSKNMIVYNFHENKFKLNVESDEFSENIQELEIHLIIEDNNQLNLNPDEILKNEIFPFLTFDTNLESALKFIANFINKILKPKCHLIGKIFINGIS